MHIADVTMFYAAESGGVRRYLDAKRSWLATRPEYRHTLVLPLGVGPPEHGVAQVPSLPLPFSHGYRLPLARRAAMRALVDLKPDIIEAGDPYRLAWAALDAGQALGVPVLGFYHSDLPRMLARHWPRTERLASAYVRRLYRHFDLVLAPSEAMVGRLADMGITRVFRQPLGVDNTVFRPGRHSERWRRALGAGLGDRLLVFVGRFAPEKNVPVLAQALERLGPGYRLVLVGQGPAPVRHPRLRLVPYVRDRMQLAALMASCDAFVHAGDQETFGLVALEAMACGLPVIAPQAGGLAELVDDKVGALVPPRDPDAIAQAVRHLFTRNLGRLRAAARRRARAYDWSRVLPNMMARYEALCAIGRAAADPPPGPSARRAAGSVRLDS